MAADIEKYEKMAKLRFSDDERPLAERVFAFLEEQFKKMDIYDVGEVEPLVSVLDIDGPLRDDEAEKTVSRETLLASAPETRDGYFVVPRTVQ